MAMETPPPAAAPAAAPGPAPAAALHKDAHKHYLEHLDDKKDTLEYMMSEHLRMGGVYWGVSALSLFKTLETSRRDEIIEWILSCSDTSGRGGFSPNVGHD